MQHQKVEIFLYLQQEDFNEIDLCTANHGKY